ncbi:MAG: hypothetical protein KatS3mg045_1812 [Bellilinea sp.]|nr:MAG: hypothetical protein KatS3mg045_1812 [Bellilinea sp.]
MSERVLVFSGHEPFRTLLQNSLRGSGFGGVVVAGQVEEVQQFLKEGKFTALVVDLDTDEEIQQAWLQLVQKAQPSRLIIFPPDNDRYHPMVGLLRPATVLIKPFYLPDLLSALQENESSSSTFQLPTRPPAEPFTDPKQTLSQWLNEGNALGAVILRQGQTPLLVGNLEEEDLREAGLVLGRFWQSERQMDLIRYFRPHVANRDVLLYATLLSEGMPLGLLFDARTSLREARRVSQWFASRWNAQPLTELINALPVSADDIHVNSDESEYQGAAPSSFGEDENLAEFEQIRLDDLLGDVPPPDPLKGEKVSDWQPESDFLPETSVSSHPNPLQPVSAQIIQPEPSSLTENLADLEDTRPSRKTASAPKGEDWERETRQSYTFVLLPRSPQATLEGEIGEELRRWLPDFCATLGYTLESLTIEPRYLLWSVNLPPTVSPGHVVRIIRDQSSSHLEECIPDLAGRGIFWASAHLILRSRHTPEASLIEDFITRTRRRQGFLSS